MRNSRIFLSGTEQSMFFSWPYKLTKTPNLTRTCAAYCPKPASGTFFWNEIELDSVLLINLRFRLNWNIGRKSYAFDIQLVSVGNFKGPTKNTLALRKLKMYLAHRLQMLGEEIAFTAWPKIHSHSQIFKYGQSIFFLSHRPNFLNIFDLCLRWVSVVRGHDQWRWFTIITLGDLWFFRFCTLTKKVFLKSVHFKNLVSFKIVVLFALMWKYHNFERKEIHATVFLKWTDFRAFLEFRPYSAFNFGGRNRRPKAENFPFWPKGQNSGIPLHWKLLIRSGTTDHHVMIHDMWSFLSLLPVGFLFWSSCTIQGSAAILEGFKFRKSLLT